MDAEANQPDYKMHNFSHSLEQRKQHEVEEIIGGKRYRPSYLLTDVERTTQVLSNVVRQARDLSPFNSKIEIDYWVEDAKKGYVRDSLPIQQLICFEISFKAEMRVI